MSLEKSETFEPIEIPESVETAPAPDMAAEPAVQVQREAPRKRYAPPSAPRVMKFMTSTAKPDTASRVKA